jgi:endonuclease/exonuclease/phosphatase family metal-dependent hydrolase
MGGGIDNGSDVRLRRQLTLLADLDLDVAALEECKRRADDDSALLHLAEEQLGMTGFLAESAHHGCHLAIFVRESAGLQVIEPRHERGDPYWHAVARVLVRAKGLPEPMYRASVHFAPSSPVIRLAKAEAFELIARAGPLIAMGDINGMPLHDPGRQLGERLALAQVSQDQQGLLAGVQLPPARPDRRAVTADEAGHESQGPGRQRQRGTVKQHQSPWWCEAFLVDRLTYQESLFPRSSAGLRGWRRELRGLQSS